MNKEAVENKGRGPCPHKAGYMMRDGNLVCYDCGEPSPSKGWRANVYGVNPGAGDKLRASVAANK